MADSTESALILPVPEVELVVGPWRRRFDTSAAEGVPAHITVMFPFLPPGSIDASVTARLADLIGSTAAFAFSLDSIGWFEPAVLWLAPTPSEPFVELTQSVTQMWPALRPYGGAFGEIVPHLTVGSADTVDGLKVASAAVRRALPIACVASEAVLIRRDGAAPWRPLDRFALATD